MTSQPVGKQTPRELADEIVRSLKIGDHRDLDRKGMRGAVGLMLLAAAALRRKDRVLVLGVDAQVLHVVASPVAHGARLAHAARNAVTSMTVACVADARVADASITVDVNASGLAVRSMWGLASRRSVLQSLKLRRYAPRDGIRALSTNRFYSEYLFLAQAVRFITAADALASVPDSTLILTDFGRHAYAWPWVRAGVRRGLRTVTMVHGSPNDNYVPVLADTVLVWGSAQERWMHIHSPGTSVIIIGRPDIERPDKLCTSPG